MPWAFADIKGTAISLGGVFSKIVFEVGGKAGREKSLEAERRGHIFTRERFTEETADLLLKRLGPKERKALIWCVEESAKLRRQARAGKEVDPAIAFGLQMEGEKLIYKAMRKHMAGGIL